ncbi:NUDIX hydrolase [Sphingomonas sp. BN140010]|uniref:NUDIX hydrolase n=1 Tax=Sphingomonas arvum TaxID=2992113 RepID=A0ABT3JHL5_9SPHN|nr:NUDIX hydrolase [Sphingomonas sp. BN140010]MCW3798575.1 NUDIX hydrolase [Sphingomonas sp. BN140010]
MSDDAIPAATLVVIRDRPGGPPELLMVERPRTMAFAAGAMVFPGGRIDAEDWTDGGALVDAARIAAVRETREETGLEVIPEALVPFARWRPNFRHHRRFDTFFFLAPCPADAGPLRPQPGECERAEWLAAAEVLAQIARGEARAIFPTLRNLERLAQFGSFAEAEAHARAIPVETITPWVEEDGGEQWLRIPDHLGYPVTRERLDTAMRA